MTVCWRRNRGLSGSVFRSTCSSQKQRTDIHTVHSVALGGCSSQVTGVATTVYVGKPVAVIIQQPHSKCRGEDA